MSDTAPYATPRKITVSDDSLISEIINDEKDINSQTFNEYFGYQNLFLDIKIFFGRKFNQSQSD